MDKKIFSGWGVLVAFVLFIAINALATTALRSVRADLTDNGLYSLSEGTHNILDDLEERISLRFFFSKAVAEDRPDLQQYATRVRELLEEYAALSKYISLEVIDPEPFSDGEEQAVSLGLRGAPANRIGDLLYFGLAASNSVDDREVIPFFDQRKEEFLEYELTEIVYKLSVAQRKKVGVLSTLPLRGQFVPGQQQPPPSWAVLLQMERLFDVEHLDPATTTDIPDDVDVLMIVHPKAFSDELLYAIDQYALGGGKILAFTDAFCHFDPEAMQSQDPTAVQRTSQLDRLLTTWGVQLVPTKMAGDQEAAQSMPVSNTRTVPFPLFLGLKGSEAVEGGGNLSDTDFVTAGLGLVNLFAPGILRASGDASTIVEPLFFTGTKSMAIDTMTMQIRPDILQIVESFVPSGEVMNIAVRVTGSIDTAFPDGRPATGAEDDEGAEGDGETEPESTEHDDEAEGEQDDVGEEGGDDDPEPVHLTSSETAFNAIIVADADILSDALWTQQLGPGAFIQLADNSKFVNNCLENLCGSDDLISLRSRGRYHRPFTKKRELVAAANEAFDAERERLEFKLEELNRDLVALQEQRNDDSGQLWNEEQQAKLVEFQEAELETRRELRDVRYALRKDIDRLGSKLKFFNILGIPLVIVVGAVTALATRRGRRRSS